MCGIAGFLDWRLRTPESVLTDMTHVLSHRGPDDQGQRYFVSENKSFQIGLGHRRLAVMDTSAAGHQPMYSNSGRFLITYNGEIYNHLELRDELSKGSFQEGWRGQSDTETLLACLDQWGLKKTLENLKGMFAFGLWDRREQALILVRDRLGVKPLYYYFHDKLLLFASELKSLHKHPEFRKNKELDKGSLSLYLHHQHIPAPWCIFKYCKKIEPGCWAAWSVNHEKIKQSRYWSVADCFKQKKLEVGGDEIIEQLSEVMPRVIKRRLLSDVPVGVFLSGGYDSSVTAALMARQQGEKINTFTIGFDDQQLDESRYAGAVANYLNTEHHEYRCSPKDVRESFDALPEVYDEPMADASAIPTWILSRYARQKITVALSADGGDELFGGYDKYRSGIGWYRILNKIPFPIRLLASPLFRMAYCLPNVFDLNNYHGRMSLLSQICSPLGRRSVYRYKVDPQGFSGRPEHVLMRPVNFRSTPYDRVWEVAHLSILDQLQALDLQANLPGTLIPKVERASMAHGLECREPFLDHELADFVARWPDRFRVGENGLKNLFKTYAHGLLPRHLLDRPKQGFSPPMASWMNMLLNHGASDYLDPAYLKHQGIFNVNQLCKYLPPQKYLTQNNYTDYWTVLHFQAWHARWLS